MSVEGLQSNMPTLNGEINVHYREINHHYAEECSQDDIGSFLFTSESVGEGHPGKILLPSKIVNF